MRPSSKLVSILLTSFTIFALTANAIAADPGLDYPSPSEAAGQKAGSVLIYNIYTSGSNSPSAQNTRINITNTNSDYPITVHLYFVDGQSCSVADSLMCLTQNQTVSFLASDMANFNFLVGSEYVKFASGHRANLSAEAVSALSNTPTTCNNASSVTALRFDGVKYNRLSHVVALNNIPSRADGNDTMLILNRIGGSLAVGAASIGPFSGLLFDDAENAFSFTSSAPNCQFRSSITNSFPRTAPRFESTTAAGRSSWITLRPGQPDIALVGAQITFNPNAASSSNAFNGGHNLHKVTLTPSVVSVEVPITNAGGGFCGNDGFCYEEYECCLPDGTKCRCVRRIPCPTS
jgi:hypothetical protein